jgi:lipoprotein-releasing system ATP-binding protein
LDTESAIRADSLTKIYRSGGGPVIVFDNLSLEVPRGERLAVVGESGAGKSTLLHLLGGLDKADSGNVRYFDGTVIDLNVLNEQELADFRNRHVGFVWQNPSLLPEFTAIENVMMPLLIRGVDQDSAGRAAQERLREVGLAARATHRAGELSGGEQQRVALARALVTKPKVLLADEPTGSLDFKTSETIFELLNEVHKTHALTSVFVTHNLFFAGRCDRVLELEKGRLQPMSTASLAQDRQEAGVVKDATRLNGGNYV